MQIEFIPHKIKAAKAYISNLYEDEYGERENKEIEGKKDKLSFFQRVKRLFFK